MTSYTCTYARAHAHTHTHLWSKGVWGNADGRVRPHRVAFNHYWLKHDFVPFWPPTGRGAGDAFAG